MEGQFNKVLIIDNDQNTCDILNMYLKSSGFSMKMISGKSDIKQEFSEYSPDIIIMDILFPKINGIDILKWLRKQSDIPIIVLTENDESINKVLALEVGADDYVVKPFDPKELLARIKAVTRRYYNSNKDELILKYDDIGIDSNSYQVMINDEEVKMPPKEFELLYYLAKNKNKVFTREQLLHKVWGYDYPGDSRTVDVHVKRLREKIKSSETWDLKTVWGVGYMFEVK